MAKFMQVPIRVIKLQMMINAARFRFSAYTMFRSIQSSSLSLTGFFCSTSLTVPFTKFHFK